MLKQEIEVLRRAAAYLSQRTFREKFLPTSKRVPADGAPLVVSLRVLKLSRHPYYRWRNQQITVAELVEACRSNALLDAHVDDPQVGYRFLAEEASQTAEQVW
nr:hypothetical protein [Kocuria rhizophila]